MSKLFKTRTPKPATPRAGSAPRPQGQPVERDKLDQAAQQKAQAQQAKPETSAGAKTKAEIGGPDGPEPTRYGDWERGGICYDF